MVTEAARARVYEALELNLNQPFRDQGLSLPGEERGGAAPSIRLFSRPRVSKHNRFLGSESERRGPAGVSCHHCHATRPGLSSDIYLFARYSECDK